jgi:hypothetical protein
MVTYSTVIACHRREADPPSHRKAGSRVELDALAETGTTISCEKTDDNATADPNSIYFEPKTNDEKLENSALITNELMLRNLSVAGGYADRRKRLEEVLGL